MSLASLMLFQAEVVGSFLLIFLLFFIGIVLLIIAAKTIKIVPQASVMLIERLGRFSKVAASGLNILMPFLDKPRAVYWTNTRGGITSIDLREQYIDLPPQPVITRDNVTIHVDSVVYWQITDPVKAVYEMNDLVGGIVQLTITGMRAVMGDMDLDHTLSQRDQINAKLRIILDEATDKWGVKVTRVDVKNINPPEDVRITMEKQMTAERNRRVQRARSKPLSPGQRAKSSLRYWQPKAPPKRDSETPRAKLRQSRWLRKRCMSTVIPRST